MAEKPLMNWDNIQHFLAYVRTGSLTSAAKQLSTSPATVSRRINALEEEIGIPLLQRLPHGMVLTPGANQLVDLWAEAEQLLHSATERARAAPDGLAVRIRFSTTASLALGIVTPNLHRFQKAWPQVHLELNTSVKTIDIGAGEGDLALRFTPPERGNLLRQHVGRLAFGVYCAKSLLGELRATPLDWQGLAALGLPIVSWLGPYKVSAPQSALEAKLGNRNAMVAINDFGSLLGTLNGGAGLGLLPCLVGEQQPQLVRLAGPEIAGRADLWLVTAKPVAHYPHISAFRHFLLDCLKQHQGMLDPPALRADEPEASPAT